MERPWIQQYDKGVPAQVDLNQYASIAKMIEESLKKYAQRTALHCMGRDMTYAELDSLSAAFAAYLQNTLGLKKGDVIALMMPNILQFPICFFGAIRAGIVLSNVNPLYTPRELEHQLNDCGAKAIVILENFASILEKVVGKTKVKTILTTRLGDMLGFPKSFIVNAVVKHVKKLVPPFHLPQAMSLSQALEAGEWTDVQDATDQS